MIIQVRDIFCFPVSIAVPSPPTVDRIYTGYVTTGYHFFVQDFTITPLTSLQYTHMNLDNYKETGAGDINLRVNS